MKKLLSILFLFVFICAACATTPRPMTIPMDLLIEDGIEDTPIEAVVDSVLEWSRTASITELTYSFGAWSGDFRHPCKECVERNRFIDDVIKSTIVEDSPEFKRIYDFYMNTLVPIAERYDLEIISRYGGCAGYQCNPGNTDAYLMAIDNAIIIAAKEMQDRSRLTPEFWTKYGPFLSLTEPPK